MIKDISIEVDSFKDIFDDFDPTRQTLSRDFIEEIKLRHIQRPDVKKVRIIMPVKFKDMKKVSKEAIESIKIHFKTQENKKYKAILSIKKKGVLFCTIGLLLCLVAVFFPTLFSLNDTVIRLTELMYVPGWFGMWEGFGKLFDFPKELRDDEELFWSLSKLSYRFEYIT